MSLNRTLSKAYADVFGFFWLPCPFPGCGEMFGGHECGEYIYRDDIENPYRGRMTCKRHDGENQKEVEAAGYDYVKGMRILKLNREGDLAVEGARSYPKVTPPE